MKYYKLKSKFMKIIINLSILLLFFIQFSAFSQNANEQKFRLAQSYENSGNLESAARIYKELLQDSPLSEAYFESYIRVSKMMNIFSELIPDALKFTKSKPTVANYALLGELYWRAGNIDSANLNWEIASERSKSQIDFLEISNTQIQLRLFDKAINSLLQGRKNLNTKNLFSDELSRLYIAVGDYENGIKEIINHFNSFQNLGLAQGRIYALLEVKEAKDYIISYFKQQINSDRNNLMLLELYSSFLRDIGNYEDAYDATLKLDKLKNSGGRDIINFARNASDEGKYDIAVKSYQYIINQGKDNKFIANAMIGLSESLEKAHLNNQDYSREKAIEIIESYNKIIDEFKNSNYAQQAKLRIGIIAKDKLQDFELSKTSFNELISINKKSTYSADAAIELGLLYILDADLDSAKSIFTQIATGRIGANNTLYMSKAKYYLGEIQFFEGNFEAAAKLYEETSTDMTSEKANDALVKLGLINSNKEDIKAILLYSKGYYETFKNKYHEAIALFEQVLTETPSSQLAELSAIQIATIKYNEKSYNEARNYFQKLINDFPLSIYIEEAYFKIALSYMNENDSEKATQYFKEILVKFPNSIYLEQSRNYIRKLRGEEI